jgi:hypothetical protein
MILRSPRRRRQPGAIFTPTDHATLLPEGKDYVLELSSSD